MKDLSYLCARICNHQIAETQVGNSQTSTFPRTTDSEGAPPELEKRWCGPVESPPAASDAYIWPYTYYIYIRRVLIIYKVYLLYMACGRQSTHPLFTNTHIKIYESYPIRRNHSARRLRHPGLQTQLRGNFYAPRPVGSRGYSPHL